MSEMVTNAFRAIFIALIITVLILTSTFNLIRGFSTRMQWRVEARVDNINNTIVSLIAKNGLEGRGSSYYTIYNGNKTNVNDIADELIKKHKVTKLYNRPGAGFKLKVTNADGGAMNSTMRVNRVEAISTVAIPSYKPPLKPKYSNPIEIKAVGTVHRYIKPNS